MRQSRVVQMAQHAYDQGYDRGLDLCESLSWMALERMAAAHWSVATMAANGAGTEPRLATSAYRSGVRDALRDVWLSALGSGGKQPDGGIGRNAIGYPPPFAGARLALPNSPPREAGFFGAPGAGASVGCGSTVEPLEQSH